MNDTCIHCGETPCVCGPYVCPGCYAVAGEKCAPGCIDDEIERERREAIESGDYDSFDDEDDRHVAELLEEAVELSTGEDVAANEDRVHELLVEAWSAIGGAS